MNKNLYLVTLLSFLSLCGMAQPNRLYLGFEGGYNKNYLITTVGYRVFTQYSPIGGFNIGAPLRYRCNNWLSAGIDPMYIQKNYKLERTAEYSPVGWQTTKNGYFQLPIFASFSFGTEKIQGFLNLGGYTGYWAFSRIKGSQLNAFGTASVRDFTYNMKSPFDERKDRRFEAGCLTGLGVSYALSKGLIFIEGRCYYSLTDIQKDYMVQRIPRTNQTYGLQAGYMFKFNTLKKKKTAS